MQSGTINVPFPVPTLQLTFKLASIYLRMKVIQIAKKKKKSIVLSNIKGLGFFFKSQYFLKPCVYKSPSCKSQAICVMSSKKKVRGGRGGQCYFRKLASFGSNVPVVM